MWNEHPKPKWWRLYAIVPIALALLVIESRLSLPPWGHVLAQLGMVLVIVGMMGMWVMSNAAALEWDEVDQARLTRLPSGAQFSDRADDAINSRPSGEMQWQPVPESTPRLPGRTDPVRLARERNN